MPDPALRILITNNTLAYRAGSELYVRDIAMALMKRGHYPIAYSTQLGEVAEELRRATIPVIDDLRALSIPPDIIHGQHHLDAMTAMLSFPMVPALYVCHGWLPWEEIPPIMPGIRRYIAVDDLCRERLLTSAGIDAKHIETIYNFVDLERFKPREPLPEKPRSALVFSNYATEASIAPIRNACLKAGIEQVDVVGLGAGNSVVDPGQIFDRYDVVFAKARAALEALASGCAVIVADQAGLGGHVNPDNMAELRRLNFGVRTMQKTAVTEENVLRELQNYDSQKALRVSRWIREDADMDKAIDRLLDIYAQTITLPPILSAQEALEAQLKAAAGYLRWLVPTVKERYHHEQQATIVVQDAEQRVSRAIQDAEQRIAIAVQRAEQLGLELAEIKSSRAWRLITHYRRFRNWMPR